MAAFHWAVFGLSLSTDRARHAKPIVRVTAALILLSALAHHHAFAQSPAPASPGEADTHAPDLQTITVTVVDQHGAPIPNAHVVIGDRRERFVAPDQGPTEPEAQLTAAEGTAKMHLPHLDRRASIVAFKSEAGLDYFILPESAKGQPHEPWPDEITLKLTGARTAHLTAVDEQLQPLPGVVFSVDTLVVPEKIRRVGGYGEPHGIDLVGCPAAQAVTDAHGIATFDWLPTEFLDRVRFHLDSPDYNPAHQPAFPPRLPDLMREHPDEELTVTLVHRTKLSGTVKFADGRPAKGIAVQAQGTGRDGDSSHAAAKTRADGAYDMFAESNRAYVVTVDDSQWASPSRDDIRVRGSPIADIDFRLAKGTILRGTVTQGSDESPVAQAPISAEFAAARPPGEESALREGDGWMYPAFYRRASTDADGEYKFCVGPGDFTIKLLGLPPQTINISSQPEIVRDFHLPSSATKLLTGQVFDAHRKPVVSAVVTGIYETVPYHLYVSATTDADGKFQFQRESLPVVLTASTRDGTFRGMATVDEIRSSNQVKIRLVPAVEARGRLVDAAGKPVTTGKLEFGIVVNVGGGRYKLLAAAEAIPDDDGRFTLNSLLPYPRASYTVNYWPDAHAKVDTDEILWGGPYAPADARYHQIFVFEPKPTGIADLGDAVVSATRYLYQSR